MGERQVSVLLLISILFVGCFAILVTVNKVSALFTPPPGWSSYEECLIPSRMDGLAVANEPVEVDFNPNPEECYSMDEIRVIAPDGVTEIPRQVFDIETQAIKGYIVSCKVAFLVDAPADTNVTYYIIYNNPGAGTPVYDGLRLYEEAAGDTYNVTAVQGITEKNYARIFWKNLLDLYSNGTPATWPGGPSGWEFSQINLGTMWSDAWGNAWFGAGKTLSLLESGPIFAEFNYSEAYATDLWGFLMDFNVSTSMILRVYYQPDLNPLMKFDKIYNINTNWANYTISPGAFLDFRLANSTSLAIYSDFTYSEGWFGTTVVPVETSVWKTIWYDPWAMYGWWSYNGSRADSVDKPAANVGLVPIRCTGTVPSSADGDYGVSVSQSIDPDDHHCTMWVGGKYNAVAGDVIRAEGYVVTTVPVDTDIEPVMNEKAAKLRSPLYAAQWKNWTYVVLTDAAGVARMAEPVDVFVAFAVPIADPDKEVRVLDPCGHEIPSQVWNATYVGGNCVSANVVFLADCPASSSVTYTVLYNNPYAEKPLYDGLRVYTEAAGDTYNVTALKAGTEKNYARIFWGSLMNLYSNGDLVTWPGGASGWEFSQIGLGTLWSDAWDVPWFGAFKSLSLVQSGPVFMEFNYSEAGASDFWGLAFDYNVTTTSLIRIYYQPNLDPLVRLQRSFNIQTNLDNYTIKGPFYLDFNLANSTSQAIYSDFTYSEGWFGTTVVPVETSVWKTIWYDPWAMYGWWSYNGSRADSTDKPASNIGMIPTYSGGTVPVTPDGDYGLSVIQQIENDDHHCTQLMNGKYNGTNGDFVRVDTYLFTYGLDMPAEPAMNTEATGLRNPLGVSVGLGTRNIAISSMTLSKTVVGVGFNLVVNITVSNEGEFPECFCIELDANATAARTLEIYGIAPGATKTITIVWNTTGFVKGNYTLAAGADPVPNESNTSDNVLVDGEIKIGFPGDIKPDGTVDIYDATLLANAFGTTPAKPAGQLPGQWNSNADINGDNIVDIYDAIILSNNFSKTE